MTTAYVYQWYPSARLKLILACKSPTGLDIYAQAKIFYAKEMHIYTVMGAVA